MTLKNFMEENKDKYKLFSLGSGSAFFFIGTYPEYITYIQAISQREVDDTKRIRDAHIKHLEYRRKVGPPDRNKYSNEIEYENDLRKHNIVLKNYPISIEADNEYIKTFIPYQDREVIDCCGSMLMENHCITKVEGIERGRYWFREEFLKDYKAVDE